ncbi:MAG: sigma 54-interacting transcriptional regulator [Desulfomonilia bacterium]
MSDRASKRNIKNLFCADCLVQAILDSAHFAILATDCDGYLIYLNDLAKNLLNFKKDIRVQPVHFADIDYTTWLNYKKVIETGIPQIGVPVMISNRPLVANRSPISVNGEIVGVMSVFHELKRYESISEYLNKCKNLTQQVEALIDSSYDGIFVTDGEGNGIRSNAAYDRITGEHSADFIGKNMRDLERDGVISESVTLKVLKSKKTETIRQILSTGKEVLATGNPIFDDQGNIIMVLTNLRDLSDLNKLNRDLAQSLEMTMAYREKLQQLQRSKTAVNDLVTASEAMQSIYEVIMRVSQTDATVFLHGETGVGKDRIAEEIHQLSDRSKSGIIVKINCGAIPETLLESELFGYEKGAFTGASRDGKPGLFEIADKGTLFLDEIDSMPLPLQSKLLRVLQNFEIRRLGGTTTREVDVRLICATNQNMKDSIMKNTFRSDLYYRLNVIPIYIPPLRERFDDIPHLINLFLRRYNKKHSMKKTLSAEVSKILMGYPWPGNVRELANLVERLVVLSRNDCIMPGDIPPELITEDKRTGTKEAARSLKDQLREIEAEIILDAVKKHGNARRAARYLKVNPSTICRKINSRTHDTQ